MSTATEAKAYEIVGCGSSRELAEALFNPLRTYGVELEGMSLGFQLDIRALVRLDDTPDTYALVCVHEEKGPGVIMIPWMDLAKANLLGLKLTFHDADFIRDHLRVKLD
jgi:hypothetical protein